MAATARFCAILLALPLLLSHAATAQAQTLTTRPYASLFLVFDAEAVPELDRGAGLRAALQQLESPIASTAALRPERKGRGALTALYGGLVTLQALDAHSTFRALDAGLHETNPLMRWASAHPVGFVSLKAAATAGTVFVAERIRKKHPKRAVVFIAAINATYALVVAHNYRAPSRDR